jgi:hypothetical protein
LVSKASLHLCVVTQLFFDGEHCNRASSRSFTEAHCGGAFGQSSRRSKSSPSRPEFELSDKQFRVDVINAGFCKSWRAPAAGRFAVDLRLCWQGFTRQAFCSHPGLTERRTTIRLSRRAVTMGVSKPPPPRISALLPLNWRYDFPIFPGWLANTTISFGSDPRFVDTRGGAKRRGVFR